MVIIRQAHDRVCRTMTLQTKLPRFLPPVSPSAHQAGDRLSLPAASRCDNRLIIQMFLVKKSMESVFVDLKKIMKKYQHMLEIIDDTENVYSLNSAYSEKYKRKIWFVGIRIMKNYVGYHLMPVYIFPELIEGISPEMNLLAATCPPLCFGRRGSEVSENKFYLFASRGGNLTLVRLWRIKKAHAGQIVF